MKSLKDLAERETGLCDLLVAHVMAVAALLVCAPAVSGDYFFLGVGNDGYVADVHGIQSALTAAPNWQCEEVHSRILSNRSGQQVGLDLAWLTSRAQPGDLAFFMYSGHGASETYDFNWDEPFLDYRDESIGLQSGDPGLTDDEMAARLSAVRPDVMLVIVLDTCHAGGFADGLDDLCTLPNAYVMMSSQSDESSWGGGSFSVFSGHLIDGISRHWPADTDRDGSVTLDEWFSYGYWRTWGQTPVRCDTGGLGPLPIVATPEPATLALLSAGALSVICRWMRSGRSAVRREPCAGPDDTPVAANRRTGPTVGPQCG